MTSTSADGRNLCQELLIMQVDNTDVNSDRDAGHRADIEHRHTKLFSQESNPMKTNPPKIKDRVPKEPKAPRKQHMPLLTTPLRSTTSDH